MNPDLTAYEAFEKARGLVQTMKGEVQVQLKLAVSAFINQDEKLARRVIEREDYIDNLYVQLESEIFLVLRDTANPDEIAFLRTSLKTAKGLEKIADHAENIAKQALHMCCVRKTELSIDFAYLYRQARKGIDLAVKGFLSQDIELANRAAHIEKILDNAYSDHLNRLLDLADRQPVDTRSLVTQMFASKYLEKIGDIILDIAEEVLSFISGERLKITSYAEMNRIFESRNAKEAHLVGIWGTRSGSRIYKVETEEEDRFIYKEGTARKIRKEAEKLKRWREIDPDIVSEVVETRRRGRRQILVTTYVPGFTLQEILQGDNWDLKEKAVRRLLSKLLRIWSNTLRKRKVPFEAMQEMRERMDSVYSIHKPFRKLHRRPVDFCGLVHPSLDEIFNWLEAMSARLRCPFSVYAHGDLNNDNIVYEIEKDAIRFIDVNRSLHGDYLKDISVLLVSNLRMKRISDHQQEDAERLNGLITAFARDFAGRHGDELFEERLLVLTARSLITSTRFVGDFAMARKLFLEGVQKLEEAQSLLEP